MKTRRLAGLAAPALAAILLQGCATWSYSTVEGGQGQAAVAKPTNKASIQVMESDASRKYTSLGDITVTVNKTTVFHPTPTRALVDEALKEKAAELGADAVVLVRYGTPGISALSWGSLEGKGRAVKYVP